MGGEDDGRAEVVAQSAHQVPQGGPAARVEAGGGLVEEENGRAVGAGADDPLPGLVGGQIAWIEGAVVGYVGQEMMAGRKAVDVSRDALVLLDEIEGLLGEKVLNYARRAAE